MEAGKKLVPGDLVFLEHNGRGGGQQYVWSPSDVNVIGTRHNTYTARCVTPWLLYTIASARPVVSVLT